MVELEFDLRPADAAPTAVSRPDELLQVVWDSTPNGRRGLPLHGDHGLRSGYLLLLALFAGYEQGVDLVWGQAVVVPVEAILEPPIDAFADLPQVDGVPALVIPHLCELVPMQLVVSDPVTVVSLANPEDNPSLTRERTWTVGDPNVLDPAQHGEKVTGRM